MTARKPDARQIKEFLLSLAQEDWIRRNERRWWPQFLFHFTDLRNAISILKDGCLYSRSYVEANNKLQVSSGSEAVLATTDSTIKDCVRLYFRPKTPTQFYAEGIKSQSSLQASKFPNAHCPVMVFFLFDAAEVLARADCQFSDGNLGSPKARLMRNVAELQALPWKQIYHQGALTEATMEKSNIIFRRNAEVIVANDLPLDALRFIYCRSTAEKETLLHLLEPRLRQQYQSKIVSTTRSELFFRQHTFVETVRLSDTSAHFYFSPDTKSSGPFNLRLGIEPSGSNAVYQELDNFSVSRSGRWNVEFHTPVQRYRIQLQLDDHLVYANQYENKEFPV